MEDTEKLRGFLEWFITPQNESEQKRFGEVLDDYLELKSSLPTMTREEIIARLNAELEPYGQSLSTV